MDPITMYAAGQGLQALGNVIDIYGERKRRKKQVKYLRENVLEPIKARQRTAGVGPSEQQGAGIRSATQQVLGQEAQKGTLNSSFAPARVAGAIAPFEMQRQAQLDELSVREAAAQAQIADIEGNIPGYTDALAGAAGQAGQFMALRAGTKQGSMDRRAATKEFFDLMATANPGMFSKVGATGFAELSSGLYDNELPGNYLYGLPLWGR